MVEPHQGLAWLPQHQHHVVFTLAHVDHLISRVSDMLFEYTKAGPLDLRNVADGELAHVTIAGVAPLPQAVSRFVADSLTQLRAALEHTLFAEVEHRLGRELTASEERSIEMPTASTSDGFGNWTRHRSRRDLSVLHEGAELCERIRSLQPFQAASSDDHPLKVLAAHTNLAKHRAPAVAATLLGTVRPDRPSADLVGSTETERPLRPGDILMTGPLYRQEPISIFPKVSVLRPHTRTWHVLLNELGELEQWVRTVAVPVLVAGRQDLETVPPQIDITVGHADFSAALAAAGTMSAKTRAEQRLQAAMGRDSMVEIFSLHSQFKGADILIRWLESLSDAQVIERLGTIISTNLSGNLIALDAVIRSLILEAENHSAATSRDTPGDT
ncbi:hypothetical protein [Actinoplanes sichuanensis]|uniref:Uncharacterized protein n=1 Tax=Actinoplanes sichuanensis TaxID=512349 RepID=A0ABW4A144_9ACTN